MVCVTMKRQFDSPGEPRFLYRMTARLLFLAATSAAFAATSTPGPEKAAPTTPAPAATPAAAVSTPATVPATPAVATPPTPAAAAPAAATPAPVAASVIPQRHTETRYAKLRSNSPFALATAEAPKEEVIPWAQNLYLGGGSKIKQEGVEKDWAVIKDRTQPGSLIQLFGNEENKEGYQLVKLEWSEDPKKTKATVKKGTEFATLEFDQGAFTSAAPAPMPQPGGQKPMPVGMPRQPGMPQAMPVPAGSNAIRPPTTMGTINRPATPMPGARPPVTIPRPANMQPAMPQPGMPQNPAMAPGNNSRQRIRVIPSQPNP